MRVYRIAGRKYAFDLSGTGAAMNGGRWNKKGTPVLYTGESREIALLEIIVHTPLLLVPALDLLIIEIPDGAVTEFSTNQLPPIGWITPLRAFWPNWVKPGCRRTKAWLC
jgi:RES domain-containing protein